MHPTNSYFTQNKQGFNLVELIVVVSILAILSTTGFLFAAEHTSQARDSKRVLDITALHDGARMHTAQMEHLPIPKEKYVHLSHSGQTIGYQSGLESHILRTFQLGEMLNADTDSKSDDRYTYRLHANKEFVQFMGFLERPKESSEPSLLSIFKKPDTSKGIAQLYPYARGDNLGVFLTKDGRAIERDIQETIQKEITSILGDPNILIVSNETTLLTTSGTTLQEIKTASVGE